VASGKIGMIHKPAGQMLADVMTKPFKGNAFKNFRDVVLGIHFE